MTIQRDIGLLRETEAFEMFDRNASVREVAMRCEVSERTAQRLRERWLLQPPHVPLEMQPVRTESKRPLQRCYHCGGTVLLLGEDVRCVNCGRAPLTGQAPLL